MGNSVSAWRAWWSWLTGIHCGSRGDGRTPLTWPSATMDSGINTKYNILFHWPSWLKHSTPLAFLKAWQVTILVNHLKTQVEMLACKLMVRSWSFPATRVATWGSDGTQRAGAASWEMPFSSIAVLKYCINFWTSGSCWRRWKSTWCRTEKTSRPIHVLYFSKSDRLASNQSSSSEKSSRLMSCMTSLAVRRRKDFRPMPNRSWRT